MTREPTAAPRMLTCSAPDLAVRALALIEARSPTLGDLRVLAIDGPAGSGKTTLAAEVATRRPGSAVLHVDDLLDGWEGLPRVGTPLRAALEPLRHGRSGRYRRYDWLADAPGATAVLDVPPSGLVVVEGVGAGGPQLRDLLTVLVWVEAPSEERLHRGLARDGAHLAPQWHRFRACEQAHFAAHRTEATADLRWWTGSTPPPAPPPSSAPVDARGSAGPGVIG